MSVDDRAADRQPHAETVGLRRNERREDALPDGGVQSGAAVLDRDQDVAWLGHHGRYRQLPRALRDRFQGVDCVQDQVYDYLLQLYPVAHHGLIAGDEVRAQRDAMPLHLAVGERQHLSDGVVDVERRDLRPGFLRERPQPTDHVGRALAVAHYLPERLTRFLEFGRVPLKPAQPGAPLTHDGGERLIDLVCDRGGELAHGREPCSAGELRLRISQRLLGMPALGDVHDHAGVFEPTCHGDVWVTHYMEALDRAVGQDQAIL